jgi:RNA-directed DNA polymerase
MKRLCRDSSRPYLGRSAPPAPPLSHQRSGSTASGNAERDGVEVSREHSSGKSGKASEALQGRKAETTDRPSRNDSPRRLKLKVAGTAAARSRQATKPTGQASTRHAAEEPARKAGLLEQVLASDNMQRAWEQVRANQGAAGIDGMSVKQFPSFAREHWPAIRQSLLTETYQPAAVRRVEIPKPDGGRRPLGIPTVLDRVIQQALAQVLNPIFDPLFAETSYGFRPNRSAHDAVKQVRTYIQQGYRLAVDVDLSKFFDTVNHDVLMHRLARRVSDKRVLRLIGKYLRGGVVINGQVQPTPSGVPQGGPLSPLLANTVLDDLDKELQRRGHRFARYADDFIILVKSQRAGERVLRSVGRFLQRKLKLVVNAKKSRVCPTDQSAFLGFTFKGTSIRWTEKALAEFKRRVRLLTGRSWGVSMDYRLKKLAEYVRGWMGYYALSEYYRPIPELDHWLRRRVRCCYWKQWRWCRRRVRELLKLGTFLRTAIHAGLSRKSYWRLSKTLATQSGMTNEWLAAQGLVSIKTLWVAFHYPSNATKG